jgi:hypothetical protein
MLASITPLGERGRHNRWGTTVGFFLAGSTLAGALLGGLLGALGRAANALIAVRWDASTITTASLIVLAVAAAIGLVFDLHLAGLTLPNIHRQVDERWLDTYRGWVYGLGFGFQLGLGVVTIVSGSITYLTFVAAFLSGSVVGGLVIGAVFGLARALPILLTRGSNDPGTLRAMHQRSNRWRQPAHVAALAGQGLAIGLALGLATVLAWS